MRNPMNKRLPRELKSDFGKYLVIFLFIVMVVSVVSSFLVANAGIAKSYKKNLANNNVEDGHVSFNVRPEEELLKGVEEKAGVKLYQTDYFEEERDDVTFRVYRESGANLPEVTEGKLPEKDNEILLDNMHFGKDKFKVGDRIALAGRELTISGFAAFPNYSALFKDNADLMFDNETFIVGMMTEEGFDAFESDRTTISYAWIYNNKPATDKAKQEAAEKVLEALREEILKVDGEILQRALAGETGLTMLEATDFLPEYENKSITFAGEDMSGDEGSMVVFLYIVVAVLAFIVAVTTMNTISKEAAVIGTLRASGYTRGEMVRHYMTLPLLSFFAGMLVGNVLGYTLMRDFMVNI